ncbi:MAG: DNA recombination protein RmuC [Clostridia bacterium]|nr:DNA recombination protein RmuC [Clostridia bacterium]
MEALIIINLILAVLALVGIAYIIFKPNGKESDEAIKKSVREAIGDMSTVISSSISLANNALIASVTAQTEKLERDFSAFKEANSNNHIAVINSLNDNFKQIIESNAKGLDEIRRQNAEKLDAIQKTVDEKLENTLSARLKASFDNVINQIGAVNTAVGEIKGLAKDVSSLNHVLTNVKTKGIVGEIALANIIEQTLTPDQYETNKVTKQGSSDPVEFAVKMPNGDDGFIYMPIDAKFPLEAYHAMKDASDELDKEKYEGAKKELKRSLKVFAKKIHDKYIDPPATTDFAVMFLPIEGLYVEALDMGLFEELQREYKINIAGPSTLTALLNALQVGFKSLVIQKRSSQVFDLLGAVKAEFATFGEVLAKAQKKFGEANDEIERLVGVRTRKINLKLREITELPEIEASKILDDKIEG